MREGRHSGDNASKVPSTLTCFSNCSHFVLKSHQNSFCLHRRRFRSVLTVHTETLENADAREEHPQPSLVQAMWCHCLADVCAGLSFLINWFSMTMNILHRVTQKNIRKEAFSNKTLFESTGPELYTISRKMGAVNLLISFSTMLVQDSLFLTELWRLVFPLLLHIFFSHTSWTWQLIFSMKNIYNNLN